MMGMRNDQGDLFSYDVNLDRRVPSDHPLGRVREAIDFSFVRSEVVGCYGIKGHVSEDPEVILKLMFLLFFDNLPSERELIRQVADRLDYLWFLGFSLDDKIPDHSILSKARHRWGGEVFEGLFVRTVRECVLAGLVAGEKLHFDGSLVDANASKDSVVSGPPELISALRATYRRTASRLDEDDDVPSSGSGSSGSAGSGGGDSTSAGGKKGGSVPGNDRLLCRTDPDAPLIRRPGLPARPRYKHHRGVDDRCGVVTAVVTTPGDVEENAELAGLISASEWNTGIGVTTVVADSQYGTAENFRELQRRGIHTHMADLGVKATREAKIFRDDQFRYDASADEYVCPAGARLRRRCYHSARKAYDYQCRASVCDGCSLRSQCTQSKTGRTVMRYVEHDLVEAGRAESASRAGKRDRLRRKSLAEGSFADAANNHGLKRSRWRGLWRQRIQDQMIAACQNIRKLMAALKDGGKSAKVRVQGSLCGLTLEILTGPCRQTSIFCSYAD
jgi:transposase